MFLLLFFFSIFLVGKTVFKILNVDMHRNRNQGYVRPEIRTRLKDLVNLSHAIHHRIPTHPR